MDVKSLIPWRRDRNAPHCDEGSPSLAFTRAMAGPARPRHSADRHGRTIDE